LEIPSLAQTVQNRGPTLIPYSVLFTTQFSITQLPKASFHFTKNGSDLFWVIGCSTSAAVFDNANSEHFVIK
jgi:hypothetical protein